MISFVTRPKSYEEIKGLVIGTMDIAKQIYKGAPVNEEEGEKVIGNLNLVSAGERVLEVSRDFAEKMKAGIGDIVYVSDKRWWLGGLRSIHTKISGIHAGEQDLIKISHDLVDEGELLIKRRHRVEKIF